MHETPTTADHAVGDLSPGARLGVYVVALAAAVLSFDTLAKLAWSTGSTSVIAAVFPVAWLLPIALDAAAGVGTFVWRRARRPEVAQLARRIVWSAIALSIAGNATQHAHQAANARPGVLVAILVGAVAPAVFGAVVHLAVVASGSSTTDSHVDNADPTIASPQLSEPVVEDSSADVVELPVPPVVEPVVLDDRPVEGPLTLADELRSRPVLPSERALVIELRDGGDHTFTRHRAKVVLAPFRPDLTEVAA